MTAAAVGSRQRAWVEVDHRALVSNLEVIRRLAGANVEVIAVVKANAYGHGAAAVSETLIRHGVDRLAVATVDEAEALRQSGLDGPMLLLWGHGPEEADRVLAADLEPILDGDATRAWQEAAASRAGRRLGVHLKVDTGLGRQGVDPAAAFDLAVAVSASRHLYLAGTMTHLAAPGDDEAFTDVQLQRFAAVLDRLRSHGIDPGVVHVAATGALLAGVGRFEDGARAVRPGLGLYGMAPPWVDAPARGLEPILSLRALPLRVFEVAAGTPIGYGLRWRAPQAARLATLPIGYGDGWPRQHANNGFALVRGRRVPMVGAISMDGLVVDVSEAGDVGMDDEFVLIGGQDGERITADEVAAQRRTINYEVTTALRGRLPRRHRVR